MPPDRLEAVVGSTVLADRFSAGPATISLHALYYDTSDRRLSAALVALRVRLTPGGYVQTLKAGLGLTRAEWEWPVADQAPNLEVIDHPGALKLVAGLGAGDLVPVFETRIRRTVALLDRGSVELAIDRGEIVTPDGREEPVSEIELELKSGEPASLYRLALELAAALPLGVEPRSKAERGFALAAARPPGAVKAHRMALSRTATLDSTLAAIFGGCFGQFTANLPCILVADDPEGIHQARVALRRLRSALALFRHLVPPEQGDWLEDEIRWLTDLLGPVRDWDVFLTELLAPVRAAFGVHPDLHAELLALEETARSQRQLAYLLARETLLSPRHTALHLRFGAWLEGREWRGQPVTQTSAQLFRPLGEAVDALLARRHRKVRRIGADFAELPYPDRHRLRIAIKKLRYASDFFRGLYEEKPVERYLQQLGRFQDTLGHINDVSAAARLLPRLAAAPDVSAGLERAVGIVVGWHGRELAACEPRLVAEWQDFRKARPFWGRPEPGNAREA